MMSYNINPYDEYLLPIVSYVIIVGRYHTIVGGYHSGWVGYHSTEHPYPLPRPWVTDVSPRVETVQIIIFIFNTVLTWDIDFLMLKQ